MHIDLCIVSSDLNKNYVGLFPFVKRAWEKMGIETLLILVANHIPDDLINYRDNIVLFEPIENIHTAFQALIPDKNMIISDIDILPLDKNYFVNRIKEIPDGSHIIFRDSYIEKNMYAVCYHLAHSFIWKNIFGISDISDVKKTIKDWYNEKYDGSKNCEGWFTDQHMLYKYINQYDGNNLVILKDSDTNFKRLDKRDKKYIVENKEQVLDNIQKNTYTDFHIIRPYQKYTNFINKVIDTTNYN